MLWGTKQTQSHYMAVSALEISCPNAFLQYKEVSVYVEQWCEKHSVK
jgi:hypothetical protein